MSAFTSLLYVLMQLNTYNEEKQTYKILKYKYLKTLYAFKYFLKVPILVKK